MPSNKMNTMQVMVKFDRSFSSNAEVFEEIKKVLNLAPADIDAEYGAVRLSRRRGLYLVLVEEKVALRLYEENHPNVAGVYGKGPAIEPADTSPAPSKKRGPGFGPA